jgi:hypothetical protein
MATVAPNMLQATWNEVEYRLDICRVTKGAHIEIYWESYVSEKNFDDFPFVVVWPINMYNKCSLRYNYFILDTFHPDTSWHGNTTTGEDLLLSVYETTKELELPWKKWKVVTTGGAPGIVKKSRFVG